MVARALRRALRKHHWSVQEQLVPLDDKTSEISLPSKRKSAERGVHVFFEELFPRCGHDREYLKHPNVVFFNLRHFKLQKHCEADGLAFCSRYLMQCFLYEAALQDLPLPPAAWAPLPLPLHDFPSGYPSLGAHFDQRELAALSREVHLGHAVRHQKSDPFATLCIMHHLNALAQKYSQKPFRLMVCAYDMPRFSEAQKAIPIPPDTLNSLVPIEPLKNAAMISIMRHACYSLCYDTVVEAFGFYPVESVYCGCPVFTNGSGNLRYLLPRQSGIEIHETPEMYLGRPEDRARAYFAVAERIFRIVTEGSGAALCQRGARYIDRHYSFPVFARKFGSLLTAASRFHKAKSLRQGQAAAPKQPRISPYLRMASWKTGQFVTDLGTLAVPAELSVQWERVLYGNEPTSVLQGSAIPPVIGFSRR